MSDTIQLATLALKSLSDLIVVIADALRDDDLEKVQEILGGDEQLATTLAKQAATAKARAALRDDDA